MFKRSAVLYYQQASARRQLGDRGRGEIEVNSGRKVHAIQIKGGGAGIGEFHKLKRVLVRESSGKFFRRRVGRVIVQFTDDEFRRANDEGGFLKRTPFRAV